LREVGAKIRIFSSVLGDLASLPTSGGAQDHRPRISSSALKSALRRDGTVFQSAVHPVGGVIAAGDADNLSVEAKINPQDIDQMQIGQKAMLRFTNFNQRTTPEIDGTVDRISADTSTDQRTGATYYTVRERLCQE
jgi:hypothetical protein